MSADPEIEIVAPRVHFPSQAHAEAAARAMEGRRGTGSLPDGPIELWLAIASEFGGSVTE